MQEVDREDNRNLTNPIIWNKLLSSVKKSVSSALKGKEARHKTRHGTEHMCIGRRRDRRYRRERERMC